MPPEPQPRFLQSSGAGAGLLLTTAALSVPKLKPGAELAAEGGLLAAPSKLKLGVVALLGAAVAPAAAAPELKAGAAAATDVATLAAGAPLGAPKLKPEMGATAAPLGSALLAAAGGSKVKAGAEDFCAAASELETTPKVASAATCSAFTTAPAQHRTA